MSSRYSRKNVYITKLFNYLKYGVSEGLPEGVVMCETKLFYHLRRIPIYVYRIFILFIIFGVIPWALWRVYETGRMTLSEFYIFYVIAIFIYYVIKVISRNEKDGSKRRIINLVSQNDLSVEEVDELKYEVKRYFK